MCWSWQKVVHHELLPDNWLRFLPTSYNGGRLVSMKRFKNYLFHLLLILAKFHCGRVIVLREKWKKIFSKNNAYSAY